MKKIIFREISAHYCFFFIYIFSSILYGFSENDINSFFLFFFRKLTFFYLSMCDGMLKDKRKIKLFKNFICRKKRKRLAFYTLTSIIHMKFLKDLLKTFSPQYINIIIFFIKKKMKIVRNFAPMNKYKTCVEKENRIERIILKINSEQVKFRYTFSL